MVLNPVIRAKQTICNPRRRYEVRDQPVSRRLSVERLLRGGPQQRMPQRLGQPRIEQVGGADRIVRVQIADAKRFEQLAHGDGVVLLERQPERIDGGSGRHHDVGAVARVLRHEGGHVVDAGAVGDPDGGQVAEE